MNKLELNSNGIYEVHLEDGERVELYKKSGEPARAYEDEYELKEILLMMQDDGILPDDFEEIEIDGDIFSFARIDEREGDYGYIEE